MDFEYIVYHELNDKHEEDSQSDKDLDDDNITVDVSNISFYQEPVESIYK